MKSRNNWADIPPEIVDEILGYCDELSLLILSRVNHQLNSLALSRYFAPQITGDVICLSSETPSLVRKKHIKSTRALRNALWLPRSIQHIDYRFMPATEGSYLDEYIHYRSMPAPKGRCLDRYIKELRDLTVFIRKMPKLVSLRIDSNNHVESFWSIDKRSHRDIWTKLFEAAVSRGCEVFEVREKGIVRYSQSFSPLEPAEALCASTLRSISWLFHNFGQAVTPKCAVTARGVTSLPSEGTVGPFVQRFQIDGSIFGHLPFVVHAILVHRAASITHLSLTNLKICDQKQLKKTLKCIQFTVLESLTFASDCSVVSPTTFLKFLCRHPTLVDLDLYVEFQKSGAWPPKEWTSWRHPPKFPNLQSLRMLPEVLEWLVPDFRRCPKLRSVTLRGPYWSVGPNKLQDMIGSILNNLHAPTLMTQPLQVEMMLSLDSPRWVCKLGAGENGETPPSWSRVKELRLNLTGIAVLTHFPKDVVDWISTFPSLEYLELDSMVIMTQEVEKEFVKSLMVKRLKRTSFVIFGQKKWVINDGNVESHTL